MVWCVKYRKKLLDAQVEQRLKQVIREVAKEHGVVVEAIEADGDHVHVLCDVDPQWGINRFVKACKGTSSRVLRSEFPHLKSIMPALWTNSYLVATTGGAPLAVVKAYVESQKLRSGKVEGMRCKS